MGMVRHFKFWGCNHISQPAKATVFKFYKWAVSSY